MAKVLVVYWSGTGNTEIMAEKIKEGLENAGESVDYYSVEDITADEAKNYDKIAFGCPSMGVEVLEEDEFEPFFQEIENNLSGKKVALFGSYGWGDGEWMEAWEERTRDTDANLFETLMMNSTPSGEEEEECISFGERFAKY